MRERATRPPSFEPQSRRRLPSAAILLEPPELKGPLQLTDLPGELGWVDGGTWEAIHADWPAYPGDRDWRIALLRLGDFPQGTVFTCLDIIDQCALLVAEVGITQADRFDERHMHVALRLAELLELDGRGLVVGIDIEENLSTEQLHLKRTLGPDQYDRVISGEQVIGTMIDGEFTPMPLPDADGPSDGDNWAMTDHRTPERVAMFEGSQIHLNGAAWPEVERVARSILRIPPSVQDRISVLLRSGLFDSAVRDLGAALESRMRAVTGTDDYGQRLIDRYVQSMLDNGTFLPARVRSLRQELRALFKFVRNEFAHSLQDVPPPRGYALISRMCWHLRDVELVADAMSTG